MADVSRNLLIIRLLYVSIGLCTPILALTFATWGSTTSYISIGVNCCTIGYASTVVLRHFKFKQGAELEKRPTAIGSNETNPLPTLCRFPTIILAFLISAIWIADLVIGVLALVVYASVVRGDWRYGVVIGQCVLFALQVVVLSAVGVMCVRERKSRGRYVEVPQL
ncbi:hypothetical protein FA15DRAFT_670952 [Coprinopsis marcescibilis]|uniref:Uncharacterized protein n=1 Tax=Coprinopsis marcescibilis TaxID=230819 RepID=A0A5C3KR12_COPMA|nr:hypothetical protein FA15DRAFT_670952 [Coprinopsis marcescibilis]